VIAVTALVGLVATTACGADSTDGGGGASGGDLAVAGQFPTESIDPNGPLAIDGGTRVASIQLYSPLLDTIGPGEFEPKAAESWEMNDTATEFTFTLRDGITFSDGSPITGQDVATSFERTVAAKSPFSANFVNVGVTATDDTVTFTPAAPDPALLAKVSEPERVQERAEAEAQLISANANMAAAIYDNGDLKLIFLLKYRKRLVQLVQQQLAASKVFFGWFTVYYNSTFAAL